MSEEIPALDHSSRDHALCGASNAKRWMSCPGSVGMELRVPEPQTSEFAKEGTRAHELSELILIPLCLAWAKGKDKLEEALDFPTKNDYPKEMVENVELYVRAVWDKVRYYKPKKVLIERRLELDSALGMFGTADVVFGAVVGGKRVLFIIDLKYGQGVIVEVEDNEQLAYYAAAGQAVFGKKKPFDEARVVIVQPRVHHDDGPVREASFTKRELETWEVNFKSAAREALQEAYVENEAPTLNAGEWCQFCKAKPICPAHVNLMSEEAGIAFADETQDLTPAISTSNIPAMSDERISQILSAKSDIENFLKSLYKFAIDRYQAGNPIPGWKLVNGRSQRRWSDNSEMIASSLKNLGIEDPFEKKLRGLGSIESELKNLGMKEREAKNAISHLVEMTSPKESLVPESDDRPGIDINKEAADVFSG